MTPAIRHKASHNRPKKPSITLMILKLLLILALSFTLLLIIFFLTEEISYYGYSADESNTVNLCNYYYYNEDYSRLRSELTSEDLTSDTYAVYREITDAYYDYMQWLSYSRCSDDNLPGASAKAAYYADKVTADASGCSFPENQSKLDALAALVNE